MNGSEFPLQLPPSDPPFIWDFGLTGFNQRTNQRAIRLEPQHEVAPLLANLQIDPLFLQTPEPIPDPELAAQKDAIHFRQAHPGLYIPTDVLQDALIYEKKIIKHESSTLDAYQGNLIATCTWSEYEHPILVYPKGPMLDILNVCPLQDLDAPINIAKIKPPKRLGFTNINSTIKHVEFSKKHYMGKHRPLLAVRTDYQIILFDLKKKKFHNEVRLKFKKMEHFQFNCRIFNFAFNPTLEKEISFVTEDGCVYLWEGIIDPKRIRILASKDPIYQTWRQVEYGSDPRTLLLCSQHDVYALDFRGPTTEVKLLFNLYSFKGQLDSYEEGDNKLEQTICAVKRHPVNPFQFFLSTTHYIMVFDERAANDPLLTCAHNLDLPPQAFFTDTYEEKVLMLVTNYKSGEIQFWQFKSTNIVPANVNNNNNNNSLGNSSEIQEPSSRAKKKSKLSEGLSNFLSAMPVVPNPINWKNHFMSAPSQTPTLLHTPFKLNTYASSQDDSNFLHFFSTKSNHGLCGVLMQLADIERLDDDATQADPEFLMYRAKGGKSLKIFHASVHGDIFFQNFAIQPLNNANIASPRKLIQKDRNVLMSPIEKDISERNMALLPDITLKERYTANLWGLFKHITEDDKVKEDLPKETKQHSRIEKIMEKVMIFIKRPRTFAEILKYVTNELNAKVFKQDLVKELDQRVVTMSPEEELEFQEHPAFEVIFKKTLVIMQSVKEQILESNFSQNEEKMNQVAHWAENLQHDYGVVYCAIPFSRVKGDLDPLVPAEMEVDEDANKTVDNSESQSVNTQAKPGNKRNEMLTKLQEDWNAAQERFLNADTSINLTQHTASQIEDIQRRLTFQTPRIGSTQLTPRAVNQSQNSPTKRTAATPYTPLISSRRAVSAQQTPTQSAVTAPMVNVETIELPSVARSTNKRPAPTLPTRRTLNLNSAPSTPAHHVTMTPVMFAKESRPSPVTNEEFNLTTPKRARTITPQTPSTPSVMHMRMTLGPGSQPQTVVDNDDMYIGSQSSQDPFASQPQSQRFLSSNITSTPTVVSSQPSGSTGSKKRKRGPMGF